MAWNYRVIRSEFVIQGGAEACYSIHRCYYAEPHKFEDLPVKWAQQPATPEGETIEELKDDLTRFLSAFDKPTLCEKRGKLKEYTK